MESTISATPNLDSSVPFIETAEPSPLDRIQSTASLAEKSENGIPSVQPVEQSSEILQTVAAPLASEQSSELSDSTVEYSPAPDCGQCVVPVPEPVVEESRVNIEEEERQTPDTEIDDLRRNPGCFQICREFARVYDNLSNLTESLYAIPFWIVLMALPISAGFMGARYLNDCTYSPPLSTLTFLMGITGVVMITARVLIIIQTAGWEHRDCMICLQGMLKFSYILALILYFTELMVFWRYTPTFNKRSPEYCNPTFYTYVLWSNCATISACILMLIIRIPTCITERYC